MDWLWSLPLTIGVFLLCRKCAHQLKLAILNPLLLSMLLIIPFLLVCHIPYDRYFQGSQLLNWLLQPAVVALAYPLYALLGEIRTYWRSLLLICLLGSLAAMISGTLIALLLGASPTIAASILPKSITTPIAITVAQSLQGIPSITAACVMYVGILGASLGHAILNYFRVQDTMTRGLAIGSISHALGTARSTELDLQEGAYSSLALVLCGVFCSLLAPIVYPWLMAIG